MFPNLSRQADREWKAGITEGEMPVHRKKPTIRDELLDDVGRGEVLDQDSRESIYFGLRELAGYPAPTPEWETSFVLSETSETASDVEETVSGVEGMPVVTQALFLAWLEALPTELSAATAAQVRAWVATVPAARERVSGEQLVAWVSIIPTATAVQLLTSLRSRADLLWRAHLNGALRQLASSTENDIALVQVVRGLPNGGYLTPVPRRWQDGPEAGPAFPMISFPDGPVVSGPFTFQGPPVRRLAGSLDAEDAEGQATLELALQQQIVGASAEILENALWQVWDVFPTTRRNSWATAERDVEVVDSEESVEPNR